ncbi:MAG TPA: cellulose biosynthesis cyclic di-GMP-binding regulatory protein BcsB [Limnobacter sp.]|uniref:cellulose biosynthesis cyclic di-GMP-binding regulatory protein BcsB n=1 Tax=Limnobacter sp. TaxID=2003368 RepID=UPI002E354D27|nr:cellulose biosynthesis cyclic di-GMP-binding regulatory protein BcsB [Limnobacter sp.]HEX5484460.1 cellulose biosynthesis cyclic di-GMP-binding regulatory protein BcsB [Limnobacter sp.]
MFKKPLIVVSMFWLALTSVHAQAPELSKPTAAQSAAAPVNTSGLKSRVLTLAAMGQPNGIKLTGLMKSVNLSTGVRLDEFITAAKLDLKAIYPPGMRHDQSFIRVYVNDQLAGMAQLKKEDAGALHDMQIDLNPNLFSDFTNLRIEYDGTYDAQCVSQENPTLRFDISPDSTLTLVSKPLTLVNDLALLPAPFFDPRDNSKLNLQVVLPASHSAQVLKAAGILTSWFGAQAFYRQAEFHVVSAPDDDHNTVILSLGDQLPQGQTKADIRGPTLEIEADPVKPWIKRLYVIGRNEDELTQAVLGLVLEAQTLSGQKAEVKKVDLGPNRKPYDAPRYVPTSRPVRFAELMDYPRQLEVSSDNPTATLNLRLPPDLFSWAGKNIPMSLKYRYTAPSRWNDSLLNIEINNNLIQSFRLPPRESQNQNRLGLNLLGQTELAQEESFQIPAFRVGGSNQLSFGFAFMPEGEKNCSGTTLPARGSIDPESTLDFSDLPHYTPMPNLTAFANGGYPFTIYADLSHTAVVLPVQPNTQEVNGFLNVMGLFGQWTGLPGTRVTVLFSDQLGQIQNKDWIALGTTDRMGWLDKSKQSLPMVLTSMLRTMSAPLPIRWFDQFSKSRNRPNNLEQGRALIEAKGELGAIMGFESSFAAKHAGLVITGTDSTSFERALGGLSNYDDVAKIRGNVTLFRGEQVESFNLGHSYVSGNLPWWLRVRIAFSEYPALIAVTGAVAGILIAVLLFGWLSKRASRRMQGK